MRASAGPDRPAAEFPAPRFPAGVGVPPLVLLTALGLGALGLAAIRTAEPLVVLGGPQHRPGVVPAVALTALAAVAWLVLRLAVVAPVRRLQAGVLAGDARRSVIGEVDRIAVAVRRHGPVRRRLPLAAVLAVVATALVAALSASFVALAGPGAADRPVLTAEAGADVDQAAARLRSALLDGLSTLQGMSGPTAGGDPDAVLRARPVFRAAYLLDPSGRQLAAAGTPLRTGQAPPGPGISQANTSGSRPVIVAAAPRYDGTVLVGEYDPRALNRVLRDNGVRLRVADPAFRTVLSNRGYEAFSALEPELSAAADAASAAGTAPAAVRTVGGADAAVAVQRLGAEGSGDDDALAGLRWVLVGDRYLAGGAFLHDGGNRAAVVVVALTTLAVLAVLLWIHLATVRPLRAAGRQATAVAAARRGAAPPAPLPAQRMDEIGGIAVGLNRILHALGGAAPLPAPRAERLVGTLITGDMISRSALWETTTSPTRGLPEVRDPETSAFARV